MNDTSALVLSTEYKPPAARARLTLLVPDPLVKDCSKSNGIFIPGGSAYWPIHKVRLIYNASLERRHTSPQTERCRLQRYPMPP